MAQFDTEYQRLEASYSDSPPGEEDLLVHVAEGSKCEFRDMTTRPGAWMKVTGGTLKGQGGRGQFLQEFDIWRLYSTAPWHHIENLDLFFSRISFMSLVGALGPLSLSLS